MDRKTVQSIRDKLQSYLKTFESQTGLKVIVGNAKYTDSNVTFKVEVAEIRNGQVADKKRTDFLDHCHSYGMRPEHLGQKITIQGTEYEIIGAAPRSYRRPILIRNCTNNKIYKDTPLHVSSLLKHSSPNNKRTEAQILEEIRQVEGDLSPENLSCDGEATSSWIAQEGARLRRLRAQLVSELGREPTSKEIWGF